MADKVIRDGKVAVLVSGGFGAGWSSWVHDYPAAEVLYDPGLVALVEKKEKLHDARADRDAWKAAGDEALRYVKEKWPKAYDGGVDQLRVVWVPVGRKFRINEYDGSESLVLDDGDTWETA